MWKKDKFEPSTEGGINKFGDAEYDHQSEIGTQHLPIIILLDSPRRLYLLILLKPPAFLDDDLAYFTEKTEALRTELLIPRPPNLPANPHFLRTKLFTFFRDFFSD